MPYAAPTTSAAPHSDRVERDAYGEAMPVPDDSGDSADDDTADKPGLDAILQKVLEAVPFQLTTDGGPEAARQRFRDLPRRPVHQDLRVEERTVDGPGGPVRIRLYWPPEAVDGVVPVVMFFHGGGWVVGDLDSYDGDARRHAVGSGALVASVDYRLAPEHPYPAAVDDVWAATQWVAEHADELGADPKRLAVAGDSAGGNLAAVVAQMARAASAPPIAFQLLWYPATTWDTSLPSFTENADAPILALDAVAEFSRWYASGQDLKNPPATLVPGRAADFSDLAPAYIAVAGYDPLRDDGVRYGELLTAAGVPVEVHNAQTLVHGYLGYAGVVPAATDAVERGLSALRRALA
ncbi:MAG: acetyl esterase [Mycobacterium sp.]|jgi:acetyl esterase|nr:acetyl esterase [Mycobacterium sp.]